MKNLLYLCSLIALLVSSCIKHDDELVIPVDPCKLVSITVDPSNPKICPNEIGKPMEVWFRINFDCDEPNFSIVVNHTGNSESNWKVGEDNAGLTQIWKSLVFPVVGAGNVTATYTIKIGSQEKAITFSCGLPDEPEECLLNSVVLVSKSCPAFEGDKMKVVFDITYTCSFLPPFDLGTDHDGSFETHNVVSSTQNAGTWKRRVESYITPSQGANDINANYTVSFEGMSKSLSVNCDLPDPEECELVDLRIEDVTWINSEHVELLLYVVFENCSSIPTFNLEVTDKQYCDPTVEHIGSFASGNQLIYKIRSVIRADAFAPKVYAKYTAFYNGQQQSVVFEADIEQPCRLVEIKNQNVNWPLLGDPTKSHITFDLVFENCDHDPGFSVDYQNNNIPECDITVDVLSTSTQGNKKIFHMYSLIEAPTSLSNKYVEYKFIYEGTTLSMHIQY